MTASNGKGPRTTLTGRGWSLLGGAVGLLMGAPLLGASELAVPGVAALAVLGVGIARTMLGIPRVAISRSVTPPHPQAGDAVVVELHVANRGSRSTPTMAFADPTGRGNQAVRGVIESTPSGSASSVCYRLTTTRRGRLSIGPLALTVTDPFGLAAHTATLGAATELVVRPSVHVLVAPRGASGRRRDARVLEAGALVPDALGEFLAPREYAVGDDLRRIHWRATARVGELMVRQDEAAWRAAVTIALDGRSATHDEESFEAAVVACASIVSSLHRSRRPFALVSGHDGGVDRALHSALDHLALVAVSRDDLGQLTARLASGRAPRHTVVVAGTVDEALVRLLARSLTRGATTLVATGPFLTTPPRGVVVVDAATRPLREAMCLAGTRWPARAAS